MRRAGDEQLAVAALQQEQGVPAREQAGGAGSVRLRRGPAANPSTVPGPNTCR
jgi:hypothetical protein